MLVERLIHQRVWFGIEDEIIAVRKVFAARDDDYQACKPAIGRLLVEVGRRLALEPDLPRIIGVARQVFGLVRSRGNIHPNIRDRLRKLEQFRDSLLIADREWNQGRPPSQEKALGWLAEQADRAGMTVDDARESLYETPERWELVAATIDPEMSRRVSWKVEVSRAEAEFDRANHKRAMKRLVGVLAREEDCASAHEALAKVFLALGRTRQAIDQLRAAVRTGNASAMAWNDLAWSLLTGGAVEEAELDEAYWAVQRAIALAPRSTCWDTLAEVLSRKGDLPGAIAAARAAIRLDPDQPSYRRRMRLLCSPPPSLEPPSSPASTRDTNPATLRPDLPDSSLGMIEKDIFEDTDFSLEVDALDPDHDDRTMQLERSSDFDLEESDSASEVFALDEDDVDQNAATAMGAAFADDESGERPSAPWPPHGLPSGVGASHAPSAAPSDHRTLSSRPMVEAELFSGLVRRILQPLRKAAASLAAPKPVTITDRVQFSMTAPATLEPGRSYALDVWAYVEARRAEVMARARESQGTDDLRVKTKDGVVIARGVALTVCLTIPTLAVADPEDVIAWDGKIGNATFPVSVPMEARPGPHAGTATFHVDQLPIAKLHFVLEIGRGAETVAPLAAREVRCKCAFASYASEDRDEVLGRLQGIMKVLPDLDLFLDVASLRSGERWEERLYQEITRRETLYLFWSLAASRSPWVEREWRTALAFRGIAGIDPVPLVSPEEVPPPPELARHLHFNDWLLAFSRGRRPSESA